MSSIRTRVLNNVAALDPYYIHYNRNAYCSYVVTHVLPVLEEDELAKFVQMFARKVLAHVEYQRYIYTVSGREMTDAEHQTRNSLIRTYAQDPRDTLERWWL